MDSDQILAEVALLRDHLYKDPKEYVAKWSSQQLEIEVSDVPLIVLVSLLANHESAQNPSYTIRPTAISAAVRDIVQRSGLKDVLEHDAKSNSIRFRSDVAAELRDRISEYLLARASVLWH